MSITGDQIVSEALKFIGTPYVFRTEVKPGDPHPRAFDCSELVEYCCNALGVKMPDGSYNQYSHCSKHGLICTLDKGWQTRGALLFRRNPISHNIEHVAFSLGDNNGTIEARGRNYGVNKFKKRNGFTDAALIPGVAYDKNLTGGGVT